MPLFRIAAVAILIVFPTVCAAAEPLHSVIDRELKAAWAREKIAPAPALHR